MPELATAQSEPTGRPLGVPVTTSLHTCASFQMSTYRCRGKVLNWSQREGPWKKVTMRHRRWPAGRRGHLAAPPPQAPPALGTPRTPFPPGLQPHQGPWRQRAARQDGPTGRWPGAGLAPPQAESLPPTPDTPLGPGGWRQGLSPPLPGPQRANSRSISALSSSPTTRVIHTVLLPGAVVGESFP